MSMIEVTESAEEVERQLAAARKALKGFEDGGSSSRMLERLRAESPGHPILLMRGATLFFAGMLAGLAVLIIAATVASEDIARALAPVERAIPVPPFLPANLGMPILLLSLASLMGAAWFLATQAAVGMGRDAALLPAEQKQHQQLLNEVTRLTTQRAVMDRIKSTPQGARPRVATPVPVSMRSRGGPASMPPTGAAPWASGSQEPPAWAAASSLGRGGESGARPMRYGVDGPSSSPPGVLSAPAGFPRPVTQTPPGGGPRAAGGGLLARARTQQTPPPGANREFGAAHGGLRRAVAGPATGTPLPEPRIPGARPRGALRDGPSSLPEHQTDATDLAPAARRESFRAPRGGDVMGAILEKAQEVAASFPVQVRLDFGQEDDLPLTLVISRATPAMAIRALLQYVELLAKIPTPPRARVELLGVPQVANTFHRNVQAALEPHFGDAFEFENEPGRIEITFAQPDPVWKGAPRLSAPE